MRNLLLKALSAAFLASLPGCSGTIPKQGGLPEQGISAVIVGGRFLVPTGETQSGRLFINFDGEGGRRAEIYRLPVLPRRNLLYQVEPGLYRLSPTRNVFGFHQPTLKVRIEGTTYRLPFPRDILRKAAYEVKPKKIAPLGVFEVKLQQALPGQPPTVKVRLDDSIEARRQTVQTLIHEMMDPAIPIASRESAIAWSRALQNSLMELVSETERTPLFKSGQ